MKTEDLVSMLATGADPVDPGAGRRGRAIALGLAILASALAMSAWLGVRSTLADDLSARRFWVKEMFCLLLATFGVWSCLRLARPGRGLGYLYLGIVLPVLGIALLAAGALAISPPEDRHALVFGQSSAQCPWRIAALALPVFAVLLWSMRQLAPTRPRLSGAAAGFAAGAVGALIYSLHCPELAAPFIVTWYLLGMLVPAAAGALLGRRMLGW